METVKTFLGRRISPKKSISQVNGGIHDCVVHTTIDLGGLINKGKS